MSPGHPLSTENALLKPDSSGYLFTEIGLAADPKQDSIVTIVEVCEQELLVPVELDIPFFVEPGFNVLVSLQVNYLKWFEGVDLRTSDPDHLSRQIVDNIADSFSLVDIQLN